MGRITTIFILLMPALCIADDKQRPKVTSEFAKAALSSFEQDQATLSKQFEEANSRAADLYLKSSKANTEKALKALADAQDTATKAADLDEALRIRDAIMYIKSIDPAVPAVTDMAAKETIAKLEREVSRLNARSRRTSTSTPGPSIPREAMRINGHAYLVVPGPVTWHLATKWCEEHGGYLVQIESDDENKFVGELLRKTSQGEAWIGGTDEETEGVWKFPDGSPLKFTKFGPTQPNNAGGVEHYLVYGGRGWYDIYGGKRTAFVCEWSE